MSAGCLALILASPQAGAQVSVWTYHNNNYRTGANTNETILNLTNVNSTLFGRLFTNMVDGCVYAQPLYVPGVAIPGQGTHNILIIATEHNTVYAFDANVPVTRGGLLWKTNLGPSAVTTIPGPASSGGYTNKNFGTRYNGNAYTDIMPEVGITGTPVIDTNSGTLYVDAFTGVVGATTNYFHTIHALNITNGTERSFSPVVVTASVAGTGVDSAGGRVTFNPEQENQRPALTLAGGIVYVAYAGYADTDPYHGWIIGFNATNLVQLTNYVFCTDPNATTATFGVERCRSRHLDGRRRIGRGQQHEPVFRGGQREFQRHERFRQCGLRRQLHETFDDERAEGRGLFRSVGSSLVSSQRYRCRFRRSGAAARPAGNCIRMSCLARARTGADLCDQPRPDDDQQRSF